MADRSEDSQDQVLKVGSTTISPGERRRVDLEVAALPTRESLDLPVVVVNGSKPGTNLWINAGIHGDELNGIEIVRKVLEQVEPASLRGSLFAVPIVNVFGFVHGSRYLPDRRDLNRSFPGSPKGSLAARLAHVFMKHVVADCTHGIDLHTGSGDRENLPQIRANLNDPETLRCARAFAAPVLLHSKIRDGSLRSAAAKQGATVLVHEGGGPHRFQRRYIETGVRGVMNVMRLLDMVDAPANEGTPSIELTESSWVRARCSGLLRLSVDMGQLVQKGEVVGDIGDSVGEEKHPVRAPNAGIVIGVARYPLVYQGDAIIHLGHTSPKK